jgi:hypothetical protein
MFIYKSLKIISILFTINLQVSSQENCPNNNNNNNNKNHNNNKFCSWHLKISTFVFLWYHVEFFHFIASCSNCPSILFYVSAANVIFICIDTASKLRLSFNIIIWSCVTNCVFKISLSQFVLWLFCFCNSTHGHWFYVLKINKWLRI